MINPFHYRPIDDLLFAEVRENVARGESTILLAPRFGGSRYSLFRLHQGLAAGGDNRLVYLRLARHDELTSAAAIRRLVEMAIGQLGQTPHTAGTDSLLAPIDRLHAKDGKPLVLLIGNVDYLPYHLSSRLLEEVRSLEQAGKAISLLSGEDSFYDLAFCASSGFTHAHRYVLQGLSLNEFHRFSGPYLKSLRIKLERADIEQVWELTGGNRHMLRILLWAILERRGRLANEDQSLDILDLISRSRLPGPYGAEIFRHPLRLIAHEPRSWLDLQRLIEHGTVELPASSGPPTPLELSGVSVRAGSTLRFSSPWMATYIKQHFVDRRWGDLYARQGEWPRAFLHYGRLAKDESVRPSTAEDRLEVELTVRSLSAALFTAIHEGTDAVRRLFARGCRYVLGFQEVGFWVFHERQWILDLPEEPALENKPYLKRAHEFLPLVGCPRDGIIPVPEHLQRLAVAAAYPGLPPFRQRAVVLSNFRQGAIVSRERERLAVELIRHFITAHGHALAIDLDRDRLAMRNTQLEVMNGIFSALGSQVLNVNDALIQAAAGLRRLGYSRVLFCLVNPAGDRIQGALDAADDPDTNVAELTDWRLDEPKADLQPYVIFSRRPKIVEDATREPLANVRVVTRTHMKAFAIVPLIDQEGEAIGTVHVERRDRAVPSADEVADLLEFGRQLAIAIEQIQRVKLLQTALDEIPEPVLIVDRAMRLLFTNAPAALLLAQQPGWYDRRKSGALSERELGVVWALLKGSLDGGQRLVREIRELGPQQTYRGVALADAIKDWKGRTVGAVLHLQDLNYLYHVLTAFRLIAESSDTTSALRAILRAAASLGHQHGRLMLVDDSDPARLVGHLTLTPDGEILEDAGPDELPLPRRDDVQYRTWNCIDSRRPIIACWREDRDDGAKVITSHGLEATNSRPPRCPNEVDKQPGMFWIDFPLITPREALGKLTLSCDPALKPEDFHLLRLLAEMAAGLLDAFVRRERMIQQVEERVLVPAAEQAMAVTAHSIATRLGALPLLLARYRRREASLPGLRPLNDSYEHTINEVLGTILRFKERLASVKVEARRIDLLDLLRTALSGLLGHDQWRINCDTNSFDVDADPHLLENALLELVQNSREMIAVESDLFINVTVVPCCDPAGNSMQMEFADNGPGIPENLRVRVFEPFFSRRPGRRNSSGLGLAFVQRVVSGHGGTIVAADAPETGARFVLTLPRFT